MKRHSSFVPLAVISLIAGSCLALVACGGDDDESDRQASGGSGFVVDGNTGEGSANKSYRGVSLTIENDYGNDIEVEFKGRCNQRGTRLESGTNGFVKVGQGQRARWRSCDELIAPTAISWKSPERNNPTVTPFIVYNQAVGLPRVDVDLRSCLGKAAFPGQTKYPGPLKQNQETTLDDEDAYGRKFNCGGKIVLRRESDSANYKQFYMLVRPD